MDDKIIDGSKRFALPSRKELESEGGKVEMDIFGDPFNVIETTAGPMNLSKLKALLGTVDARMAAKAEEEGSEKEEYEAIRASNRKYFKKELEQLNKVLIDLQILEMGLVPDTGDEETVMASAVLDAKKRVKKLVAMLEDNNVEVEFKL